MHHYTIFGSGHCQYLFPYTLILFFLNWIFSDAQGLVLVYSVASRFSFKYLEDIHQSMLKDKRIFVLVGTQCDWTQDREVSKADGAALARQFGCDFIETSAKTTQNIERLFINLVRSLRQTNHSICAKSKQEPHRSALKERKPCNCIIL